MKKKKREYMERQIALLEDILFESQNLSVILSELQALSVPPAMFDDIYPMVHLSLDLEDSPFLTNKKESKGCDCTDCPCDRGSEQPL